MKKKQPKKKMKSKKVKAKKIKKTVAPAPVMAPQEITIVNQSVLAPELVENKLTLPKTWVSEKQVIKMVQQTPREHIYSRPAKGGGTWQYVTGTYVQKVLNYVFGWLWDFEIVRQDIFGLEQGAGQIVVLGKLTVKDGKGNTISKQQYGRADVKYKRGAKEMLDLGNDFKAAATDALKKCASELGIASDVYGKTEFKEVGKTVLEPQPLQPTVTPGPAAIVAPPALIYECKEGAEIISKQEYDYSKKLYNKALCREHQKGKTVLWKR